MATPILNYLSNPFHGLESGKKCFIGNNTEGQPFFPGSISNDLDPKKTGLIRDRIPTKAEMASLHAASVEGVIKNRSPIAEIFKFISMTGARLGEVLHMEWEDLDEKTWIWTIRSKPRCPTFYGLGWKPKWDKWRQVPLFDDAI